MKFQSMSSIFLDEIKRQPFKIDQQIRNVSFEIPSQTLSESSYIDHQIMIQLHYVGKFSAFYFKGKKYFIGTEDGKVFIRDGTVDRVIELISPKMKQGIMSNLIHKITPFKSTIEQPNKKSFLVNLVDFSYKRQPTFEKKYDMGISAICLSEDEELLIIAVNCGEIHIYQYSNYQLLETIELWSAQSYLYIYHQSSQQGVVNIIEKTVHIHYEFLSADKYGTIHKLYLDFYKLLNQKSITYKHFLILERGQTEYVPKWWEQAQMEMEVQIAQQQKLLDLIPLKTLQESTLFAILWQSKFEIMEIFKGKKEKQLHFQILQSIERIDIGLFYDRFNILSKDEQINPTESMSMIGTGIGTYYEQIYNSSKITIIEKTKFILYHYGPIVYIYTANMNPYKFGIISYPVKYLKDDNEYIPSIKCVNFIDCNIIIAIYNNGDSELFHLDNFGVDMQFAKQFFKYSSKISQKPLSDLVSLTTNGQMIYEFKQLRIKYLWNLTSELIYLEKSMKVIKSSVKCWKAFLNQFNEKKQYLDGLIQCYNIMRDQNKHLNGLPHSTKEMKDYIKELVINFIHSVSSQKLDQINFVIQYLLQTQNEDILFNPIRKLLKIENKLDIFYKIIENHPIQTIPSQDLLEMSKEMNKDQLYSTLQKLDPFKIDITIISHICMEQGFIELMIYFSIINQEFLIPIQKLLDQPILIQYLLLILNGFDNQYNQLIKLNHWMAIKSTINYIFIPQHFPQILLFDPTLQVAINLFQSNINQIIQQQQQYIQIELSQDQLSLLDIFMESNKEYILSKLFIVIYQQYNYQLEQQLEQQQYDIKYLNNFLCTAILSETLDFKREIVFKSIKYFFDRYIELGEKCNQLLLNLLRIFFQKQINLAELDQFDSLLNFHLNKVTLLKCYLLQLRGQQINCFKQWLEVEDMNLKQDIFEWLNQTFKRQLQIFITDDLIIFGFRELLKINPQRTFQFINTHLKNKQIYILNCVKDDDNQTDGFVEYMEQILEYKVMISDQMKVCYQIIQIKYIRYLCINKPKLVKGVILQYNFPLKECLEICKQFNNIKACKQIYILLGDYKKVVEILSNKLVLRIKICIKTIVKTKKLIVVERQSVLDVLHKIRKICLQQQTDYELRDNLWLLCLDRFFKDNPLKNLTLASLPQLLKDQLLLVTTFLLYNMLLQMNFYDFVQLICIKYHDMPVSIFSKILNSIKDIRYQQEQLFNIGQILFENDMTLQLQQLFHNNMKGFKFSQFDCNCEISDQFVIIYRCNHVFHICCLDNNKAFCPLCLDQMNNAVYKIKSQKIQFKVQAEFQPKSKKYHERYDKLRTYEHQFLKRQFQYQEIVGL